jgi:vesicle-fusing ATPase
MPPSDSHATSLEVAFDRPESEILRVVEQIKPHALKFYEHTLQHPTRLIKPMISFDATALAISFVPAAGEEPVPEGRQAEDDQYTYHHFRRDLYNLCMKNGIKVESRYVNPSAHITIARFISGKDFNNGGTVSEGVIDPVKTRAFVHTIEELNAWLEAEYWPVVGEGGRSYIKDGGEWIVGQSASTGLDLRHGTVWYGGGTPILPDS